MNIQISKAKKLASWSVFGLLATVTATFPAQAIVTSGNPDDYIVTSPSAFDGVVDILVQEIVEPDFFNFCSGSLLTTGKHILTAAHCLTDDSGVFNSTNGTVRFEQETGEVILPVANYFVHPDWMGNFFKGGDLAILELESLAPDTAQRYDIYRGSDEAGRVGERVGYGRAGNGNEGQTFFDLTKRSGKNLFDAVDPAVDILFYDFDNGLSENDALGSFFGLNDLGLGEEEVFPASGDSGGPAFIDGLIAGITSFRISLGNPPDIDAQLNSSFGEFGFDTRVSGYTNWIDGILSRQTVPEPSTMIGYFLILGFGVLISKQNKKR